MLLKKKPNIPHEWHEIYLCYLANLGYQIQNTKEYKSLVHDAKFLCKHCGRIAADEQNLCKPVKL